MRKRRKNWMSIALQSKPFAWSWSKVKNFETCPKRYEEVDVKKAHGEQRSVELDRGDDLHEAMRRRVQADAKLPPQFGYMERWAEKLTRTLHPYQIIQCELKLSADKSMKPTGYFDKDTWVRVRLDYFRLIPSDNPDIDYGHIVDYKTGKPPKIWDGTQLMVNARLAFAHYKTLQKVRVDYLWTEYNDTTYDTFSRAQAAEGFDSLLPRVTALEQAHKTGVFPARPCGLCMEYCPVTSCEHWGKRPKRN
jgi:hypothetical protein